MPMCVVPPQGLGDQHLGTNAIDADRNAPAAADVHDAGVLADIKHGAPALAPSPSQPRRDSITAVAAAPAWTPAAPYALGSAAGTGA